MVFNRGMKCIKKNEEDMTDTEKYNILAGFLYGALASDISIYDTFSVSKEDARNILKKVGFLED